MNRLTRQVVLTRLNLELANLAAGGDGVLFERAFDRNDFRVPIQTKFLDLCTQPKPLEFWLAGQGSKGVKCQVIRFSRHSSANRAIHHERVDVWENLSGGSRALQQRSCDVGTDKIILDLYICQNRNPKRLGSQFRCTVGVDKLEPSYARNLTLRGFGQDRIQSTQVHFAARVQFSILKFEVKLASTCGKDFAASLQARAKIRVDAAL